jgi:hypothetical protein
VDATDNLEKVLTLKAQRLDGARLSFNSTLSLIDEKKIAAGHYLKNWLTKSAADVNKQLEAMSTKILPPHSPEMEKSE